MAKKTTAESDEARLKKKVTAKLTDHKGPEGNAALRALRKRLKRAQRKRRALALRKKHAAGKKTVAAAPAAG
jgi:hypothetical protein